MTPPDPVTPETPREQDKAAPPAPDVPPGGTTPPGPEANQRTFRLDLGDGLDEALKKLRDRAEHYYKKGQHTQVRLRFRGKDIATIPMNMLLAVEAAGWALGAGWFRLLIMNVAGKAFLDVEFINEADQVVTAGKEHLLDGELDDALAKFRQAIQMDRDHPAAHLNLGVALKLKGQRDDAIEAFAKAVALDPDGDVGAEAKKQLEKFKK
jgi:tetratricopeptide (TPR) repeat protein